MFFSRSPQSTFSHDQQIFANHFHAVWKRGPRCAARRVSDTCVDTARKRRLHRAEGATHAPAPGPHHYCAPARAVDTDPQLLPPGALTGAASSRLDDSSLLELILRCLLEGPRLLCKSHHVTTPTPACRQKRERAPPPRSRAQVHCPASGRPGTHAHLGVYRVVIRLPVVLCDLVLCAPLLAGRILLARHCAPTSE
jgi:hypothetical protein